MNLVCNKIDSFKIYNGSTVALNSSLQTIIESPMHLCHRPAVKTADYNLPFGRQKDTKMATMKQRNMIRHGIYLSVIWYTMRSSISLITTDVELKFFEYFHLNCVSLSQGKMKNAHILSQLKKDICKTIVYFMYYAIHCGNCNFWFKQLSLKILHVIVTIKRRLNMLFGPTHYLKN